MLTPIKTVVSLTICQGAASTAEVSFTYRIDDQEATTQPRPCTTEERESFLGASVDASISSAEAADLACRQAKNEKATASAKQQADLAAGIEAVRGIAAERDAAKAALAQKMREIDSKSP